MLPTPKLDDKTFAELVEEAKALIPVYAPEWTDHNIHDPGITFVELFAWLIEMQIYRLDRVTEKNKRKFLKLLGIKPRHVTAAKVDVTFSLNTYPNTIFVPKGTKVAAKDVETGESIVFEVAYDIHVVPVKLERVISQIWEEIRDNTEANMLDGHFYHAFGERAEEGSMLYLGFNAAEEFPHEEIDLMVSLYEGDLVEKVKRGEEEPEIIPPVEVRWEYTKAKAKDEKSAKCVDWAPLELITDETLSFTNSGRISFKVPTDVVKCKVPPCEEEKYWVRCRVKKAGYDIPPRIDTIRLNTVPTTQGKTVTNEPLGFSTGLPNQTFFFQHKPILAGSQDITILDKKWKEVDDFDASGPEDCHYVIDHDNGELIFGDGVHGLIPPKTNIMVTTYRFGGGEEGNIKAGAINLILDVDEERKNLRVTNKLPASGGKEKETLEEAIIRARKYLREPYRAVTSKDYEYIAKATPGLRVKRAKAIPDKRKGSVTVVVVPESTLDKPKPSEEFLMAVYRYLDKRRLITTEVYVKEPEYVEVTVNAKVKIKRGYESDTVRHRIENRLKQFLHPFKGGPEGDGWQFGRSVFKSEIYELIDGIEGVDRVQELNMVDGEYRYDGEKIEIPNSGLVYSGKHTIRITGPEEEWRGGFHEQYGF